jgi:glycosyltransferase involved in cell wall biosynthesis
MGLDALPIAQRLGIPLLVSFHGTDVTVDPALPGRARHYRRLLQRLHRATAVSDFIEGKLRALGFAGDVDRVPAGVRLDRFPFRGPRTLNGEVRLLFVGRQVPRKGLDVLLRALPQLSATREVWLDVIGDGPSRAANEGLARELGLARRVVFHGAQPHDAVRDALGRADLLVLPSRTPPDGEAEGSPVITKEALAIGLPIVATDNGGTVETLPPAYRHELVPEDDAGALAARIDDVVAQHGRWPERVGEGRRWVEEQFDWRVLARRLAGIYEELALRP